jgi:hypothetical protein
MAFPTLVNSLPLAEGIRGVVIVVPVNILGVEGLPGLRSC